ncbi:nucleotidyltransferase family protein [Mesobacterium sp. TK19101]|uniref:Nucleotidyltransferase family protein n=1 Tax=Mesobacterium hydrothermale TaxID=3111907 RepID=A0ABU6HGM3_9RHOB|nr:nucleotidyltransferase family protein [Mesobacterium sp. TK19101]MEC3861599.1 nucleotidyltransferase family protein [Mesobacterium sp. TK19101]
MSPNAILLFAAGFGTRMGPLTRTCPKPLIRVAGRPLIDHALALADDFGPLTRVANAHYHADQLAAHLADRDVALSHEAPEILETGGGLRKALPLLGQGPVFTLNTDAVWTGSNPLATLARAWQPDRMQALLLCVPLTSALGRDAPGDFHLGPDGRLRRGGDLVYTGAQILHTDLLQEVREPAFSLNVVWNKMAEQGGLFGVVHDGGWCDVGRPEGIALAEGLLADV